MRILALLLFFFSLNSFAQEDLSFQKDYTIGAGLQMSRLYSPSPYAQVTMFLFKDPAMKHSSIAGFGLSLDSSGNLYGAVSPVVVPFDHTCLQPVLNIPFSGKLSLNVGLGFGVYF